MKIDCCGLACPEPVINTKKSLEILPDDSILEVLVDSNASKENVIRFAKNEGLTVSDEIIENGNTKITIVKGFACTIAADEDESKFLNKVLFLKDDKVGDNELGSMLVVGFLKTILELPKLPKAIYLVNRAVYLSTAAEDSDIIKILRIYEEKGVEIFSCGICLDFYKISDDLKVGMTGNAFGTVDALLSCENTITL